MKRTCARARQIGLSTLIFTEHLDFTGWLAAPEDFSEHERHLIGDDGLMQPPRMEIEAYFENKGQWTRVGDA